jgi:hypothetical protein
MNYINSLPNDMIKQTLFELSVKEIMSICSSDKSIQSICNDDKFWKDYVMLKYNMPNPWKQLAKLVDKEKTITIYKNGRITKLDISDNMTLREVLDQVNFLMPGNSMYGLKLLHPFIHQDETVIKYINNKITYYSVKFRDWFTYHVADEPISKNLLYDLIWQIDVSD